MPGCAALGCNNRSEKGFMMKCFPRDAVLRQMWKDKVGRSEWEPSKNSFLCHMHFESNQWIVTHNGRVKLKKGAVPTVFNVTSTRKSSRKRGISESDNGEYGDDYLIQYVHNDQTISHETTQLESLMLPLTAHNPSQSIDNISVISNDNADTDNFYENDYATNDEHKKEDTTINTNSNFYNTKIKKEIVDRLSNDEYMQIEKRLKLVCDGEKYDDLVNKRETISENSEIDDYENMMHESDNNVECNKQLNASNSTDIVHDSLKENYSSSSNEHLKFTIKISGISEDVYDITQHLNPLNKDIEQCHFNCNNDNFVTSEIIVNCKKRNNEANLGLSDNIKEYHSDSSSNKFVTSEVIKNCDKINDEDHLNDSTPKLCGESLYLKQDSISHDYLFVNELLQKCKDLEEKVEIQQQIIKTLSEQSIQHKDLADSLKLMEVEVKRKDFEIEQLKEKNIIKKSVGNKKSNNKTDAQAKIDEPLLFKMTTRINQLEAINKQLMKSLNLEVDKRRKAEYQVKDRENKIKELNWKLDKASKFYERSEKNTNTYRRKLSTLQTLLRRRNIMEDKKQTYKELLSNREQCSFSKKSLTAAMSILKSCGHRGYAKLLSYNFPLPSMDILLHKNDSLTGVNVEDTAVKPDETTSDKIVESELASGTVQDILNESSDDDDYTMDINEFRKYVLTDDNPS